MNAAVYARKSTEQRVSEEEKSVAIQIENARAYAAKRGWSVDPAHVYADDGVSGAEGKKLRNRQRLLDLIDSGRAPFRALVVRDQARFSREDADDALGLLKAVTRRGIDVWFYLEDRAFRYGTFQDNVAGFMQAEFAAEYRRSIARLTYEKMAHKAKAGHVTGGRVFGYDNVRVNSHVERRINVDEAAVVLDIYERYARGQGFRRIAHELNARRALCPRPQRGRPAGFEIGTVRAILERTLYRGVVTWNKSKKRDLSGETRQHDRPETEWMHVDAPALRIVPEQLALACDARRKERLGHYLRGMEGKQLGRPPAGCAPSGKYLLSGGLLRCPCGANFEAVIRPHGRTPGNVYGCAARRRKGRAVCDNDLLLDIEQADAAVLDALVNVALDPGLVDRALDTLVTADVGNRAGLEAERKDLAARISNLTTAIGMGGDIPALVDSLRQAEARLRAVERDLAPRDEPDRAALQAAMTTKVEGWKAVLVAHGPQTKEILREVVEPILVDPGILLPSDARPPWVDVNDRSGHESLEPGDYIDVLAAIRPESLLSGDCYNCMASPAGVEPASPP